jgi:hypothetical protein
MSSLPIPQPVIPDNLITMAPDGASSHQEEVVVSTGLEAPLLKKNHEPIKVWCGNRDCKCNGRVPTDMENGPFVHTWVAKFSHGHDRELGIRSYTFVPLYHENGEQDSHCAYCGEKLILGCRGCGRRIRSGDHTYCTGCGQYVWRTYAEDHPVSGDVAPLNDPFESGLTDEFPF